MKRAIGIWLVSYAALAGGCGDNGTNDSGTPDQSVPADLNMADLRPPADSAKAADATSTDGGTLNCIAIVGCVQGCGSANTSCQDACIANGKPASQAKFQAVITCGYGVCTQASDGGAAACSSGTDRSAGCQTCLNAAGLSAACSTQATACTSDP